MKRTNPLLFVALALSLSVLFLVETALWSAAIKLRVTAEQANIREKPDIASAILLQVPEGTLLEAETKQGEWYAVRIEKEEGGSLLGYVHESLVKAVPGEKPVEPKPQEPIPIPSPAQLQRTTPVSKPRAEHPTLSLWLGGRYASVGDLNEGAKGLAQAYEYEQGTSKEAGVDPLHLGHLLGLEIQFPLAAEFFFCIGAEYYSGENSSTVSFEDGSAQNLYTTKPQVRAVPISFSFLYYPMPYMYIKAGLEYTFARCAYFYRFQTGNYWEEWEGHASSGGLGYQIGLGADWKLLFHVSLVAEASYRHLKVSELEGENSYRQSDGFNSREEGRLYYFHFFTAGEDLVSLVFVRGKKPSEAGVIDSRNATLNLSGLSLRAGIMIRF
jgi:hypothetical protein